jgi:colicin import membrane protein
LTTLSLTRPLRRVGEQLGWGLGLSFLLHILLVLGVIYGPALIPVTSKRVIIPVYNVSLVGAPRLAAGTPGGKKTGSKVRPAAKPKPKPKARVKKSPKAKPVAKKATKPKAKKLAAKRTRPKPKPKARPKPRVKPKPKPKPKVAIGTKKSVKRKPAKVVRKPKPKPKPPVVTRADTKTLESRIKRLQRKVNDDRLLDSAISRLQKKVASRPKSSVTKAASAATASVPASSVTRDYDERGGDGGTGASTLSMRQHVYVAEVEARIKRHWVLPEAYVKNLKGLVAWVVVRIKRDGTLSKVWLEERSKNSRFNRSCLNAVERAAPYPPLPSEERGPYLEVGFRFRPGDLQS